jgi:hypothetical protein
MLLTFSQQEASPKMSITVRHRLLALIVVQRVQ